MKLMVSSYNNGIVDWNAEAEETALRYYTIVHAFNNPAECTIVLADPTFTKVQKYNTEANDVYLGAGKFTLEDPTGTDLFYGRAIKASANVDEHTCVLVCRDWLDQLDGEQITYDMREKLTGNIRQSVIMSDRTDTDGQGIGPANENAGTFYVYDHDIGLTIDAHNGQHLMLNAGMAGSHTWKTGTYTETVTASAAPMTVDLFVGAGADDIRYLWVHDGEYHSMSDGADFFVVYDFKSWIPDSDFFTSISGARVKIKYRAETAGVVTLQVNSGGYNTIADMDQTVAATDTYKEFEIPPDLLAGMFDADGEANIKIDVANPAGGTLRVYYIMLEIDTITTGYSSSITISDTRAKRLTIGTDLSADATKVWDELPYCVAKEIYLHLESATGPILGGDTVVTLTAGAANIENTSGISTQQFIDKTRLRILQAIATEDKSIFYITLGGVIVTYQQTFGADTVQIDDGDVLSFQSLHDYHAMYNEATAYGIRLGDYQISENQVNAASQTKFLEARSKVIKSPGIVSPAHAKAIATAMAARNADVSQMVSCVVSGNTATAAHPKTMKLGDVIEITSSVLWPAAAAKDYIICRWAYDSRDNKTYLTLYPKVSTGMPDMDTADTRQDKLERAMIDTTTDKYIPDPVSHEVT